MKFYLYECRHGDERIITNSTPEGWEYLLKQMEHCNGMSLEECRDQGFWIDESEGNLSIDDGGSIETIELTAVPSENDYTNGHTYDRT